MVLVDVQRVVTDKSDLKEYKYIINAYRLLVMIKNSVKTVKDHFTILFLYFAIKKSDI